MTGSPSGPEFSLLHDGAPIGRPFGRIKDIRSIGGIRGIRGTKGIISHYKKSSYKEDISHSDYLIDQEHNLRAYVTLYKHL